MGKRLFEAMIEANHRALAGDSQAGLHPGEFQDELPLVALTCVDVRLNALLPQALGVPPEQFIWLRNAGNIVTGPMSSTMRSLALACAVKGGKEIVVVGHTDCQVGKTTVMQLIDRFRGVGVERHLLPDNLNEFFGMFGSERQNVLKAVEFVRSSPLIGPKIPVQGLLIDIETGRVEWLVNGYDALERLASAQNKQAARGVDTFKPLASFNIGELKFPEGKIGDAASTVEREILARVKQGASKIASVSAALESAVASDGISLPAGFKVSEVTIGQSISNLAQDLADQMKTSPAALPGQAKPGEPANAPPKIPLPPPLRPKMHLRRNPK